MRCRALLTHLLTKLTLRSELVHFILLDLILKQAIIVNIFQLLEAALLITLVLQFINDSFETHILLLLLL